MSLFSNGHALLEGVPGIGKTLLIRTLASALHLDFGRIQFTPDLMPADITGTTVINESENRREFVFERGPVFTQILLADEINRATPKTQSAMLEAMQERSVTVGGVSHPLPSPFFVMATQNPIEQEGTYPLPEAQLDRFFFKLTVGYSDRAELSEILNRTTKGAKIDANPVLDADRILAHQHLVTQVAIADHVQDFAVRMVLATHPGGEFATPQVNRFIRVGFTRARRPRPRCQVPRARRRSLRRERGRHQGHRAARAAPPHALELRGRRRGHHHRRHRREHHRHTAAQFA
ncbi:MAG: AAA family ATPase [Phycisphaerales bacterium]